MHQEHDSGKLEVSCPVNFLLFKIIDILQQDKSLLII